MTDNEGLPKVFTHLDQGRSPLTWHKAYLRKRVLEEWPYGYQWASAYVDLTYSVDVEESKFGRFVRRGQAYILGFDLLHAWRNRVGMREADVIWTHTEHEHLAIALLKKLKIVGNVAVVGQSVWLWDEWSSFSRLRRGVYSWLLSAVDEHTTLSTHNAAVGSGVLHRTVHAVPFGIEPSFVVPVKTHRDPAVIQVVAPGNDRHRDWATLAEVARRHPNIDVLVLSARRRPRRLTSRRLPNFRVREAANTDEMIEAIAASDVVAIPLLESLHASGITVGFEALAAGRPVAVTNTGGVEEYFRTYVSYAEPGDPDGLADAIRAAAAVADKVDIIEANRAWLTEGGLLARDFAMRHVLLTYLMLGRLDQADAAAISAFKPVGSPPGRLNLSNR